MYKRQTLKSRVIYFSRREKLDQGVYMDGDRIVYRHGGKTEPVLDVNDLQIIGGHNHENVMTAVAISLQMGVPIPVIREACMAVSYTHLDVYKRQHGSGGSGL